MAPSSWRQRVSLGLAGLRLLVRRLRDTIQDGANRPLTRGERVALAVLVLVPATVNAVALLPELTIPVPSLNDDAIHFLIVQRAADALASGQNLFDHWLPQVDTGVPQFLYYQHLPALAAVGLQRLSFGLLDLLTTFNLVRYVLLVAFPLTVFVSMRTLGFRGAAPAIAAAASTLLASNIGYGFEYGSYIWRGYGMYTQLWAMHLSFLAVAAMYQAVHTGRRIWLAGLILGFLVLTHLVYTYMTGMAIIVIALWGLTRANAVTRAIRLAVAGAFAAAISSYMWLPFLTQTAYFNATPYLEQAKYDSFGAGPILGWLFSGQLLDFGRIPVLTLLLLAGAVSAVLAPGRAARLSLGLFLVWLVVYFGRPTLGPLIDLLPMHDGLILHRFLGPVHLAAIILIGVGGAALWQFARPHQARWRLVVGFALLGSMLAPAIAERWDYYRLNTAWEQRAMNALSSDADAQKIITAVRALPPGRVFMGLPTSFANQMPFGDLRFYHLLEFYGIEGLPPPNQSFSLNSDYIWDFDDHNQADFDLYNARYMVAPSTLPVADFLTPILTTARYTLYRAPTTGYAQYVAITSRVAVKTQAELFALNRAWERSKTLPAQRQYVRYDFPATAVGAGSSSAAACPDGGQTTFESFEPGHILLAVECPAASTLVIKTTYHPNWQVRVDGVVVESFMVSPSYIGVSMPTGKHTVDAVYRETPMKAPLLVVGGLALALLLILRGRLDRLATLPMPRLRRRLSRDQARPMPDGPQP